MATVHFASLYEIRKEAGLDLKLSDDRVSGEVDGNNRSFFTSRIPLVDRNGDDNITPADVLAFVDGVNVPVDSVVPATGEVVLTTAPAAGKTVMLDYVTGEVPDSDIDKRRTSAEDWLRRKVQNVYDLVALDAMQTPAYPNLWTDAVRLYAAALLQISDYGANVDTDGSSKDGYKKLGEAKKMLEDWIGDQAGGASDPNSKTTGAVASRSDGNIMHRHKFGKGGDLHTSESEWWNHRT